MKKILASLTLTTFLTLPLVMGAQTQPPTGGIGGDPQMIFDTVNTIANWAFAILLLGALLVVVFAAYLFLTAAGDPDRVSKARNYILYALIAVVVAFLAKAIVVLVGRMLGVERIEEVIFIF